ncbi:hypothetical protein IE81DRAFT_320871 [Ceraceosorus guamensis]|uniref:Peptidase S59 domain-containing protein n=1 Tax=Ceraceosorus guamensis TaxID=1522189 RepID=A0A316W4T7_9BASI|nr:hypothetical protein IE81DRAFT_320871 [Ceraceosorus guamensis]PWN44900.1 hypothetical protein IE81DRAFT_320871 [Ceraceosorus guamensis]
MFGGGAGQSTGFGFGAANNQQQQGGGGIFGGGQQQNQGASNPFGQPAQPMFGQPAGSAASNPFGSSSQTQPSTSFSFGGAGASTAQQPSTFGAQANKPAGTFSFGAANTGQTQSFGFGAPQPAQQPAFGAANNNLFGQKPAGGGLFGSNQPSSTGNALGQPAQSQGGIFGGTNALAGQAAMPTQGTLNPPYRETVISESDNNNSKVGDYKYTAITMAPAYRAASFEELRLQDYQQGRKNGNSGPSIGGFGVPAQTNPFGQTSQQQPGGIFGAQQPQQNSTPFGQQPQQQQQAGGMFGAQQQPQQTGGIFGGNTAAGQTGGMFGQNSQQGQQTGGFFGQNNAGQQAGQAGTFGGFGTTTPQQPAANSFGGFGQQNNTPKPGGLFGSNNNAFGAPQQSQQQQNTFGFGANNNQQQQGQQQGTSTFGGGTSTFGGFGNTSSAPKPGGLFGAAPAASTAPSFSFGATSSAAAAQPNKPAFSFGGGTNTFGSSGATTGSAAAPSQGLFGQSQPVTTSQPGGGFGSTGGFGGNTTSQPFGQSQPGQQPNQPATSGFGSGGLFGNKPATSGGLFGQNQQQQQPGQQQSTASTFGGFGGNNNNAPAGQGGGLFSGFNSGANNATKSLFGAASGQPSGGGLFGNNPGAGQSTGGLFGAQSQAPGAGGLFGQSQAAGNASLFGNTQNSSTSLFGNSAQAQPTQPQMPNFQASLVKDPYGTDALFAQHAQPKAADPDAGLARQPYLPFNVSADKVPRKAIPAIRPFSPNTKGAARFTRLRGTTPGFSTREDTPGREGSPSLFGYGSANARASPAKSLFRGLSDDLPTADGNRAASPGLPLQAFNRRSGSVRRLVLDDDAGNLSGSLSTRSLFGSTSRAGSVAPGSRKSATPGGDSLFGTRGGTAPPGQESAPRVAFSPALEAGVATSRRPNLADTSRLSGAADSSVNTSVLGGRSGADVDTPSRPPLREVASALPSLTSTRNRKDDASAPTTDRDDHLPLNYYTSPPVSTLQTYSKRELSAVKDFVVGRHGSGSVRFLEPVDLSSVPDLNLIAGGIVVIRSHETMVYPKEAEIYVGDTNELGDGVLADFEPDEMHYPPVGEGLNHAALVSLQGHWVLDKATRKHITDPSHARVKQRIAKLKAVPGAHFESYDPAEGIWRFKVDHWSRYGLDDDDDEDEEGMQAEDAKVAAARRVNTPRKSVGSGVFRPRRATSAKPDPADDADAHSEASMRLSELRSPEPVTARDTEDATPRFAQARLRATKSPTPVGQDFEASSRRLAQQPWAATLGLEPRRVQVMQASFFGQASPAQETKQQLPGPPLLGNRKHARRSSHGTAPTAAARSTFSTPASAPVEAPLTVSAPIAKPQKFSRTENTSSIVAGAERLTIDAGLSMGRSFRVGWGPDGTIAHIGKLFVGTQSVASSSRRTDHLPSSAVRLEKLRLFSDPESDAKNAKNLLERQFRHTQIDTEEEAEEEEEGAVAEAEARLEDATTPLAFLRPDTRFKHFASLFEANDRSHDATIWRLGAALFDEIDLRLPEDAPPDTTATALSIRRKAVLSATLAHAVSNTVEVEARSCVAANRPAALVFAHLTGYQIERACLAAIEAGDVRLATLVAQASGGDEETRADVNDQLTVWRQQAALAHISNDHRRVYELLAGNVTLSEGIDAAQQRRANDPVDRADDTQIPAGLDWKRAFGLHLWYDTAHSDPLRSAVERYEAAVGGRGDTAPPLPPYLQSSQKASLQLRSMMQKSDYARDALFQLIKLFANSDFQLEDALRPRGFGAALADYRLPWHLYQLLARVLRIRDFDDRLDLGIEVEEEGTQGHSSRADSLTSSYAFQLESLGLWTWAAFVLLHLEIEAGREAAIKALLARNVLKITNEGSEEEDFLLSHLSIPEAWLHEARAHEACYRNDRFAQYESLLAARDYASAHRVVVRYLAPEAIIRNDLHVLVKLFASFTDAHPNGGLDDLPGWKLGGRVYLDYAACIRQIPHLVGLNNQDRLPPPEKATLARLVSRLAELLELVPGLFQDVESSLTQKVAKCEMLASLHNLARATQSISEVPLAPWDSSGPPRTNELQYAANEHLKLLIGSLA